jgi:hypothetical protein
MIFQNFGFNQSYVSTQGAVYTFPTANNLVRVEVQVSGSNQNLSTAKDLNILSNNTGSLDTDTALNGLPNNIYSAASAVRVELNGANIGTVAVVFRTTNTKGNNSTRWYLMDGRSVVGSIANSYINQYDGVGPSWESGSFWAAEVSQSLYTNTLNSTNFTNGLNNNVGGTNWYQWTGAPANTTFPNYRLMVLTFPTVRTTTGDFNLFANSAGSESPGNMRYAAIALWSSILTQTEVEQLYNYYKFELNYNI